MKLIFDIKKIICRKNLQTTLFINFQLGIGDIFPTQLTLTAKLEFFSVQISEGL